VKVWEILEDGQTSCSPRSSPNKINKMMGGAAWVGAGGACDGVGSEGGTESKGATGANRRIGGEAQVGTRLVAIFSGHTDSVMVLASAEQQQLFKDSMSNSKLIFSGSSDKTVKVSSVTRQ
jgi:hypothetical protein